MKKIKFQNRNYVFLFLVTLVCVLGSIFSVSYAYLSGNFKGSSSSDNPYAETKFYYNNLEISQNSITGTIGSDGKVTLNVGSTVVASNTTSNISLPIYIKNAGNIDANIQSIVVVITFKSGSTTVYPDNCFAENQYYLQFNSSNFTIENNSFFVISGNQVLQKGQANSIQILNSLDLNGNMYVSELYGKSFVINLSATIEQNGIENIVNI